jgi:hypothetical protein
MLGSFLCGWNWRTTPPSGRFRQLGDIRGPDDRLSFYATNSACLSRKFADVFLRGAAMDNAVVSQTETDEDILADVSDDALERAGSAEQQTATWHIAHTLGIIAHGRSSF